MKLKFFLFSIVAVVILGCSRAPQQNTAVRKSSETTTESHHADSGKLPVLLESEGNGYFVWKYNGRIYVIGNEETNKEFKHHPKLELTKTVLGAGPNGETVIFEYNKNKPEMADQLKQKYEQR